MGERITVEGSLRRSENRRARKLRSKDMWGGEARLDSENKLSALTAGGKVARMGDGASKGSRPALLSNSPHGVLGLGDGETHLREHTAIHWGNLRDLVEERRPSGRTKT